MEDAHPGSTKRLHRWNHKYGFSGNLNKAELKDVGDKIRKEASRINSREKT